MDEFKEVILKYLIKNDLQFLADNIDLIIFIVPLIVGGLSPFVIKLYKSLIKFYKQKKAIKDLHPFFLPSEVKSATSFYIDTFCQNIPPSDFEELQSSHAFAVQERLMPFFLNKVFKFKSKPENRFYFILSDSGMGKTTFLINLHTKYSNKFRRQFKIKLLPLGSTMIDEELKNTDSNERRNTILLLDAFDEDVRASVDYKKRLSEIVNLVWDFRIVIITSRTQFFDSDINEPNETGLLKFGGDKGYLAFQKIYISPFNDKDIKKYLRKKFSLLKFTKRRKGFEIVKNCPNLMVRPMLLSYIEDLLTLKYNIKNASQSYEALIEKWIDREAQRIDSEKRVDFKVQLRKFSDELAVDIYKKRKERGGLHISADEMQRFAKRKEINLSSIEMKSRSLLNRHSTGFFKFSHRSIHEYLIALKLLDNKGIIGEFDVKAFDQAYKFYLEMFWDRIRLDKKEEALDLSHKMLFEIEPIANLNNIKYLELHNNYITKIDKLSNCHSLIALQLSNNEVVDLKPIENLKNLQFLYLKGNKINDLEPIFKLKKLQEIELTSNPIKIEQLDELKKVLNETNIIYR
jgi:hypothetical protein